MVVGYYNYYNDPSRYSPDTVQDIYQQMVERYEGDELKSNNDNPYSDINLKRRALDEKLAPWAASIREKFKTKDEVRQYLSQKYFGTGDFSYKKRWEDKETFAMYENDLNAILFGTIKGGNLNDPRLDYTPQTWEEYEEEEKISSQKAISSQMNNLLKHNGIELDDSDNFLISFDENTFSAHIEGLDDNDLSKKIEELLNSNNNSKELFYYTLKNSSNVDSDSLNKFRLYQNVKDYLGLDINDFVLKDDGFYDKDGQNLIDVLKEGLKNNPSLDATVKSGALNYIQDLVNNALGSDWENISPLKLKIFYNQKNGFELLGVDTKV